MDAEPAAMPSGWGGGRAGAGEAVARRAVPVGSLLPADSPRLRGEDRAHIGRLAETDQVLPPILVHRQTMRVIDGMHRLRAAVLKGRDRIDVEFFDGSDHEAFVRAVEANVTHGLPLSLRERKAAAARILAGRPDMSDRSIASITGLSAKTLAAIRDRSGAQIPHLNRRLGSDGRLRPLDATEARRRAARLLTDNPGAPLRQIAGATGISLGTASDVRRRLHSGQDPARTPQPSSPHKHRPGGADATGGGEFLAHCSKPLVKLGR
jgi:ParB-like chromosome segregation protein Spo0J